MKQLLFIFLFISSASIYAQKIDSEKYIRRVHNEYIENLKMNDSQSKSFKKILEEYNPKINKLIDDKANNEDINRMIKISIGKIYKVLNSDQRKLFRKIKDRIEPKKKYKFD